MGRPGKVFRHEEYSEYKAGRKETPGLLREQQPRFRPLMEAFGFVNTELPGFEADDILGTLATRAAAAGEEVVILTATATPSSWWTSGCPCWPPAAG